VAYELEPVPARATWVGLSEIVTLPDGKFAFVERDGKAYVVTDNDGVEDATGETQLLSLGDWRSLFRR